MFITANQPISRQLTTSLRSLLASTATGCFLLLASCGGGGSNDNNADVRGLTNGPSDCSISGQNQFVYDYLQTFYVFADQVQRNVDPNSYNSPAALLADLRINPPDRFSSISNAGSFNRFQEGQFVGIGIFVVRDENNDPFIGFSYEGSAAAESGLTRGAQITEINGVRGDALRDSTSYRAAFGPRGEGNRVVIKAIPRGGGSEQTHDLRETLVTINPTPEVTVVQRNGTNIGYLRYSNFFGNSEDELNDAFALFNASGVTELVLDLRYNSGGRISAAEHLGSLVGGDRVTGDIFTELQYNSQQQDRNSSFIFEQTSNALNLDSLVVLTTRTTCSSSELVINGLRGGGRDSSPATPVNVAVVGSATCGKPLGSNPQDVCDKVMSAQTFTLRNAQNEGDYFNGIPATCSVDDDLEHDLSDPQEAQFAAALQFIATGSCPAAAAKTSNSKVYTATKADQEFAGIVR